MTNDKKERFRHLVEFVVLIITTLLSGLLAKWITGDPIAAFLAILITGAQVSIGFKIDALERKLVPKEVIA